MNAMRSQSVSKVKKFFTLIREFLGPSASAISGNKIQKHNLLACYVTAVTKKIKLYVQISVSLANDTNWELHMRHIICQYEGKYAALNNNICFLVTFTERASPQKIQSTEI